MLALSTVFAGWRRVRGNAPPVPERLGCRSVTGYRRAWIGRAPNVMP
jgi:hypothetical protein